MAKCVSRVAVSRCPTTSQGLLSTAAFSTSRDSPLFSPGTKMPAIPHCVKINEDNVRSSCALGVMWHRRNALEYALSFYLLVWTSTTAKTSDTKIPVCSIRAGALSAWSLTHKREPECGDDHHLHLPSPITLLLLFIASAGALFLKKAKARFLARPRPN